MKMKKTKAVTTFTTIEQVNEAASEYVSKYLAGLTKEKLEAILEAHLEKQLLSVCAQAVGFEHHWGAWEVNHTNGRKSVITDICSEVVKDKLRAAMDELITTPTITKLWAKTLKEELNEQLYYVMRERARKRAEEILQEHLLLASEELVAAMVKGRPE